MTDDDIRDQVFHRLSIKKWMTGSRVKDTSPNGRQVEVIWTEDGIAKMRVLYALFDELGLSVGPHTIGEFEQLSLLSRQCIAIHGRDDGGSSEMPSHR